MIWSPTFNRPVDREVSFIQLNSQVLMLLDHLFRVLEIAELEVLEVVFRVDDREDVAFR